MLVEVCEDKEGFTGKDGCAGRYVVSEDEVWMVLR